jgi:tRNA threonylcarbamoyl adenosine modification protein YeaZ
VLLAFDTSSAAVTVAVADPSTGRVLASSATVDALRHGELLAPAIRSALTDSGLRPDELSRIAVGVGPGPFTGLRVGLMTARTMADVLGVDLAGVCSLDVLAAQSGAPGPVAVLTDARRKEVYWALYGAPDADGRRHRLEGPAVDKPAAIAHLLSPGELAVVGRGAVIYADDLALAPAPSLEYPSAEVLATGLLSGRLDPGPADPLYLRRPDVTMSTGAKSVLGQG